MATINGKTFIAAPMTWEQRKNAKHALTRLNMALAQRGEELEKAQKDDNLEAVAEAMAGIALAGFENREAILLAVFADKGLTQADINAETKPSNIHNAVSEVLELSKDPEEEQARKKATDLILGMRGEVAA